MYKSQARGGERGAPAPRQAAATATRRPRLTRRRRGRVIHPSRSSSSTNNRTRQSILEFHSSNSAHSKQYRHSRRNEPKIFWSFPDIFIHPVNKTEIQREHLITYLSEGRICKHSTRFYSRSNCFISRGHTFLKQTKWYVDGWLWNNNFMCLCY